MSKNKNRCADGTAYYWQSEQFTQVCYSVNLDMLLSIAVNRFRWEGLPPTCDARFLEVQLHRTGIATICHSIETPDVWQTLMAAPQGQFSPYGLPTEWDAMGMDATQYHVTPATGELVYYSQTRLDPWGAIMMFANKLTHVQRTQDVNLFHQQKPYVMVAPQEKKQELLQIAKQVSGFEPMILGDKSLLELSENNVFAIDTKVPFIGKELTEQYQNVLNEYLLFMGIPHVAFEKQERLVNNETEMGNATASILLKNCLDSRRWACKRLRRLSPETFGDTYVYLNTDYESDNFNFMNNIKEQADSNQGNPVDDSEGTDDGTE